MNILGRGTRAIEALLRRPAQDRRHRAAQEYGVSQERFRKRHERVVIEQVAGEILELCQPTAGRACSDALWPELAREIRMEGRCGAARFPVTIHVEPAESLRDVDMVIAPTNVYLQMPQPCKASVSAALRRAAARRGWTAPSSRTRWPTSFGRGSASGQQTP